MKRSHSDLDRITEPSAEVGGAVDSCVGEEDKTIKEESILSDK